MKKSKLHPKVIVYIGLMCLTLAASADLCTSTSAVGDICESTITVLHPTQFSVGMVEVQAKSTDLQAMSDKKLTKYLNDHTAPAVIGPGRQFYITDRHHLARALLAIGVDRLELNITNDFSTLSVNEFWTAMAKAQLVYLYDHGRGPMSPSLLPTTVSALTDDIYRGLAWGVQAQANAYADTTVLFASFIWADFFRSRVDATVVAKDFTEAVREGAVFARSPAASGLPGYLGPENHGALAK